MKAHTPLSTSSTGNQSRAGLCRSALNYLWHSAQNINLMQIASNLTFNTVLAVVPLLAVVLALFTAFPHFQEFSDALQAFMAKSLMPAALSESVMQYLNEFAAQASKLTAIGGAFLIVTVMLLIMSIESALNSIWRVRRPRTIANRLLVYWALISLGPILMGASLWATAYLARESLGLVSQIPMFIEATLNVLPILISGTGLAILFVIVPNCKVRRLDALIGGFLSAFILEFMKFAFAYYVSTFTSYTVIYGAFAALPVFLLWVYLSWLGVLAGAMVTASLPIIRTKRLGLSTTPGSQLLDALIILQILAQCRDLVPPGKTGKELLRETSLRPDELGHVIESLAAIGWIAAASDPGEYRWVLACETSEARFGALVDRVLIDRTALDLDSKPELRRALSDLFSDEGDPLLKDVLLRHDKMTNQPIQSEQYGCTTETHHA